MAHIVLKDVPHLEETFIQLLHHAIKTRKWQKKWHTDFGAQNKQAMKEAEAKLDGLIESLIVKHTDHRHPDDLKVHYTKIKLQ